MNEIQEETREQSDWRMYRSWLMSRKPGTEYLNECWAAGVAYGRNTSGIDESFRNAMKEIAQWGGDCVDNAELVGTFNPREIAKRWLSQNP